ncbi:hypothetical protein AzCIB_1418 [Azoarcus sp. CIB]|uniref:hypothetical protein n=1 Tax=Aromatoleum sp. (strain CIB) TaxID=198107 RepID=UPI00067CEB2A|nr:hypothetical protein [Azoarcus sp. CIB]AKU11320.1 hypothetical protein AzCIB_1418 [Azoarcus sp. CIB]
MKRADDVFFFTLIDFLVQVFFFGMLIYVVAQANQREAEEQRGVEKQQVEELKKAAGVSNLTELTDLLTRLAPITELKGFADFMAKWGGIEKATSAQKAVADAGGVEKVQERLEKLRKLEEGSGKPPCLYDVVDGKKVVTKVATVVATDSTIRFTENTPQLAQVLHILGHNFDSVRELSLADFRKAFSPITALKPDCRYTVTFNEATRYVDARDAVSSAFVPAIRKVRNAGS